VWCDDVSLMQNVGSNLAIQRPDQHPSAGQHSSAGLIEVATNILKHGSGGYKMTAAPPPLCWEKGASDSWQNGFNNHEYDAYEGKAVFWSWELVTFLNKDGVLVGDGWRWCDISEQKCQESCQTLGGCKAIYYMPNKCCFPSTSVFSGSDIPQGSDLSGGFKMSVVPCPGSDVKRFAPHADRILVQKIKAEAKTISGLLLPDAATQEVNQGTVVAVGPGRMNGKGASLPMSTTVGDLVVVPQYGGTAIKLDGEDFLVYRDEDIVGVIKPE